MSPFTFQAPDLCLLNERLCFDSDDELCTIQLDFVERKKDGRKSSAVADQRALPCDAACSRPSYLKLLRGKVGCLTNMELSIT